MKNERNKELRRENRLGAFTTKQSPHGYNVFPASEQDKKEFNATHRITSFKYDDDDRLQWTTVVRIEGDKVRFLDAERFYR